MPDYCNECASDGKLTRVAIYSRTQCATHWEAEYNAVLDSATPDEWKRANETLDRLAARR